MAIKTSDAQPKFNKERNHGVDLLRIVAMLMIVAYHFFIYGNVDYVYDKSSLEYNITWVLISITLIAVNCYVLISGYFLTTSVFRISKLLGLISQILFYSLGIYFLLVSLGIVDPTKIDTLRAVFPTLTGLYWFATVYVGMYLLSPFINKFVHAINQRVHLSLVVLLVAIFSIWPTFLVFATPTTYERLTIENGLSLTWFIVLYFIAAYIRLYYKPTYNVMGYFVRYILVAAVVAITFIATDYLGAELSSHYLSKFSNGLHAYNSLAVLASSLALFMLFINLKIHSRSLIRAISILAPLTFGVYLIHEQSHVRTLIWNLFEPTTYAQNPLFALYGIAIILLIYVASSVIDWCRMVVFKKLSSLSLVASVGAAIESVINQITKGSIAVADKLLKS